MVKEYDNFNWFDVKEVTYDNAVGQNISDNIVMIDRKIIKTKNNTHIIVIGNKIPDAIIYMRDNIDYVLEFAYFELPQAQFNNFRYGIAIMLINTEQDVALTYQIVHSSLYTFMNKAQQDIPSNIDNTHILENAKMLLVKKKDVTDAEIFNLLKTYDKLHYLMQLHSVTALSNIKVVTKQLISHNPNNELQIKTFFEIMKHFNANTDSPIIRIKRSIRKIRYETFANLNSIPNFKKKLNELN